MESDPEPFRGKVVFEDEMSIVGVGVFPVVVGGVVGFVVVFVVVVVVAKLNQFKVSEFFLFYAFLASRYPGIIRQEDLPSFFVC